MNSSGQRVVAVAEQRVVAVASGKGGVGKTLLAACIATLASEDPSFCRKVLLVDMDLRVKGLTFLYGSVEDWRQVEGNMTDIVAGNRDPSTVLNGAIKTGMGITLVPAETDFSRRIDWDNFLPSQGDLARSMEMFIDAAVKLEFDFIVFDTGAGIDVPLLALAKNVSRIIVVVEPDEISRTSAADLRGELNPRVDNLWFVENKKPEESGLSKHLSHLNGVLFLPSLAFDRKLHRKFVRDARAVAGRGFRGTRYRRQVGRMCKVLYHEMRCKQPTMWDYLATNRVAMVCFSVLGYGIVFSLIVGIVLGVLMEIFPRWFGQ